MIEPQFRYMSRSEICGLRGCGETKQREDEKAGRFPPGELLSPKMRRWRSDVVAQWLEDESARAKTVATELAEQARKLPEGARKARRKKLDAAKAANLQTADA